MKTAFTLSALLLLSICSAFSPATINDPQAKKCAVQTVTTSSFDFFRTHRQGRADITATWGISGSGNDVTGFLVERTYEDPSDPYANWEIVSAMPCNGGRSYKCTDCNVFAGFISYRVTALLTGGGSFVSPVSTWHIVSH